MNSYHLITRLLAKSLLILLLTLMVGLLLRPLSTGRAKDQSKKEALKQPPASQPQPATISHGSALELSARIDQTIDAGEYANIRSRQLAY